MCLRNPRYPACNAPTPYCHLWYTLPYIFFTLPQKRHDFRKKLLDIKCVFRFSPQILSETFLIIGSTERDMIEMYIGLHVKYPLFLLYIIET